MTSTQIANGRPASRDGQGAEAAIVVALLYLSYLLSFGDRIIFGMVLKPIKAELGFTDAQLGLLAGAAFALAYAVFSPLGGWIVDRFRRRATLALAILFWSMMTLLTGLSGGFLGIALCRAGVGVGETFLSPLAVSLIGDTVPRERRARVFGLYLSAGAVGAVLALLLGGFVIHAFGSGGEIRVPLIGPLAPWRSLFLAAGVPGVFLAIAVVFLMREPARGALDGGTALGAGESGFVRRYWYLVVATFLGLSFSTLGPYTWATWQVTFFERVHGWSATRAALTIATTTSITTLVGCLATGRVVDWVRRRGHVDAPFRVGMAAGVFFAALAGVGMLMPTGTGAIAVISLATLVSYMPAACIYTTIGDVAPAHLRGRFGGLHTLAIGVITNSLGPFLTGKLNDTVFHGEDGIRYSLLVTFAAAALVGTLLLLPGLPAYRRRMAELDQVR